MKKIGVQRMLGESQYNMYISKLHLWQINTGTKITRV